jgi:hypothetical protein
VGARTWLALNALGSYESRDTPLSLSSNAVGGRTQIAVNTGAFALLLGLRHVFAQGIVDFSMFAAAFGSYQSVGGGPLRSGESVSGLPAPGDTTRSLGVLAGLAVERELIDGLALRLSVDTLSASISNDESVFVDSIGFEKRTDFGTRRAGLSLRPGLQLYFYF